MAKTWNDYFDHYLEGKTLPNRAAKASQPGEQTLGWEARNGTLTSADGILTLIPEKKGAAFVTRTGIRLKSPAVVTLAVKSDAAGPGAIAWRIEGEKDFLPDSRVSFEVAKANEWQTCEVPLPAAGTIIHLRIHLPGGTSQIRKITLNP